MRKERKKNPSKIPKEAPEAKIVVLAGFAQISTRDPPKTADFPENYKAWLHLSLNLPLRLLQLLLSLRDGGGPEADQAAGAAAERAGQRHTQADEDVGHHQGEDGEVEGQRGAVVGRPWVVQVGVLHSAEFKN